MTPKIVRKIGKLETYLHQWGWAQRLQKTLDQEYAKNVSHHLWDVVRTMDVWEDGRDPARRPPMRYEHTQHAIVVLSDLLKPINKLALDRALRSELAGIVAHYQRILIQCPRTREQILRALGPL